MIMIIILLIIIIIIVHNVIYLYLSLLYIYIYIHMYICTPSVRLTRSADIRSRHRRAWGLSLVRAAAKEFARGGSGGRDRSALKQTALK